MGLTLQFRLQPSPTRWSAVGPRRPCPLRARNIGAWRSLTDNDGRWQENLTCGIGVASGVNGLPDAPSKLVTVGPHRGHIPPEDHGQERTLTVNRPRSSARPFGHNRRSSKHPDSLSHGGSRLGLEPRWVHAATVARGIGGHQRSPTVQRIAGRWPCSSRSRDDPGGRFGLWSDGGEGSSASPVASGHR
jgi:hypothetical protein